MPIEKKVRKTFNAIKKGGIKKLITKQTGQRLFDGTRQIAKNLESKHSELLVLEMKPASVEVSSNNVILKIVDSPDDLSYMFETREKWFKNAAIKRLEDGDICFIAVIDGKAVSCLWATFNKVHLSPVEYWLEINNKTAALIDGYTIDEYRGLGLYSKLWKSCLNHFFNSQITTIYGFISPTNQHSIEVHKKLGLTKIVNNIIMDKTCGTLSHRVTTGNEYIKLFS